MSLQLQSDFNQEQLKEQLRLLQVELDAIEAQTHSFEATLRAQLMDEIVLEQELTVLYKEQKAAKKRKRLAQKKKSKVKGDSNIVFKAKTPMAKGQEADSALRKKLYREAMMQVHPDKFSLAEDKQDLATEITSKLITLYATGSLEELKAYHQHIFSGQALDIKATKKFPRIADTYLADEVDKLKTKIEAAKQKHTYQVLKTYKNPMDFLTELQAYYKDRLFKLRKRTRTA